MSSWSNRYVGLSWTPDLYCGGLARLVYREQLSIEIPDYGPAPRDVRLWAPKIRAAAAAWPWVKLASNAVRNAFDLVVIERDDVDAHVGIAIGALDMLHIERGRLSSIDAIEDPDWAGRITGVYRHVALAHAAPLEAAA